MKNTIKLLATCALAQGIASAAPVSITPGTLSYTQNFDSLGTTSVVWTNDSTIAGWSAQINNGTTATGSAQAADGVTVLSGLLNCGSAAAADRALGSKATGTGNFANIAYAVVFKNDGTKGISLKRVRYRAEYWRGNSVANTGEKYTTFYAISAAPLPSILSGTSNATAAAGAGFTAMPAGANATLANAGTGALDGNTVFNAVDFSSAIGGIPVVPPGQYFTLKWTDTNEANTDGFQAIDNVQVDFEEVDCSITAVSTVTRGPGALPNDPTDDVISVDVTVTGAGTLGPNWTTNSVTPAVTDGVYGVPKTLTFPVSESPKTIVIADSATALCTTQFVATAPPVTIAATANTIVRLPGVLPADPSDDVFTFNANVTTVFGSTQWTAVTPPANFPATGAYATDVPAGPFPAVQQTINLTDSIATTATATLFVNPPYIIGTSTVSGSPVDVTSIGSVGNNTWTNTAATKTMEMTDGDRNNAGTAAKQIESAPVSFTGVPGAVKFSMQLVATDGSSGFEAPDTFYAELILNDGMADLPPVSLLTPALDLNGNGTMEDNEIAPAASVYTYNLSAIIPDNIQSARLIFRGICDSGAASEKMEVQNILFELAPPSLQAASGTVTFNNHNTIDPLDDTFSGPVTITPTNLGVSPGWTSDATPSTGLYTDPQPVTFGPFPSAQSPKTVTLTDIGNILVTAQFTLTQPGRTFAASLAPIPNIVRDENGTPNDLTDDKITFDMTISGTNGGPQFALAAYPATVTTPSLAMPAVATTVPVTISPAPAGGTVMVHVSDASYPASFANLAIAVPAPSVPQTQYVIGQKDFVVGGLTDVLSDAGDPVVPQWFNYPGLRKMEMTSGGGAPTKLFRTELIDLSTVGAVNLTANLRAIDRSAGFEAGDSFVAELLVDGTPVVPNLIAPHDTNAPADQLMTGGAGAADDEFNAAHLVDGSYTSNFALTASIPATANSVQLVIIAVNDSTNETFIVENVLFEEVVGPVDTDGDGMTDDYEDANGLLKNDPADKNLDKDGDGQTNYQEFLAGNTANDSNSLLKITEITKTGTNASVKWTSVPGKTYRIDVSPDMAGPWQDLGNDFPAAATPATETTVGPIDLTPLGNPLPAKYFLRVRVKN